MQGFVNKLHDFDYTIYDFDIIIDDSHYTSRDFDNVVRDVS